eukprot:gene3210-biopygen6969
MELEGGARRVGGAARLALREAGREGAWGEEVVLPLLTRRARGLHQNPCHLVGTVNWIGKPDTSAGAQRRGHLLDRPRFRSGGAAFAIGLACVVQAASFMDGDDDASRRILALGHTPIKVRAQAARHWAPLPHLPRAEGGWIENSVCIEAENSRTGRTATSGDWIAVPFVVLAGVKFLTPRNVYPQARPIQPTN